MAGLNGPASKAETLLGVITTKAVTPGSQGPVTQIAVRQNVTDGIQSDMTLAGTTLSRAVFIPAGTWLISADLVPAANTTIFGAPDGMTIIKLIGTNRGFAWTNVPGVTLRDLTIDCNKAATTDNGTTTQHGVMVEATDSTGCPRTRLERVKIINAWDRGLSVKATTLDTHPLDLDLIDCEISGCTANGVFIQNPQRALIEDCDVHDGALWGIQVVGGRNATIRNNQVHDHAGGASRGHGIVVNTGHVGAKILGNTVWNNVSANTWGIVVGINATDFEVSGNRCYDNAGGMTIDVADTVTNPVNTGGSIVSDNICTGSTLSDGIHVNQADGISITGNHCYNNEQDGISIYGRHAFVDGNHCHHNGRDGINFDEDLTSPLASTGAHVYGVNYVYDNNQNAGSFKDFFVGSLTFGGVLDVQRARALPLDVPSGEFVQVNPSPMTTALLNDGQSYSLPFDVAEPQSFDQLLFEVTVAGGTGSVCRGAIFWDDGTGRRPGRVREALGTVGTATTGVKTLTISTTLFDVGRYWVDVVPQGTPSPNPTLRIVTSPYIRVSTPGLASLAQEFLMTTGITGAFADPHATVNSNNTLSIAMALRAA